MSVEIPVRDVLFVIPALNEERNIGSVVRELREVIPGAEVLVVDDGSADGTARAAEAAGARVLRLPFNLGIGAAIQTGIVHAHEAGYRWVIRMDGDGQHDPRDVARFFESVQQRETDLLIGSRFLERGGYRSSWARRIAIGFLNRLIGLLTGYRVTDATSGFQMFSARAVARLRRFYPDDYPEPEAIIMLYKWGMTVAEVPVTMKRRPAGASSITFLKSGYYMIKVTMAILLDMVRY
jgi:glycosyltransferase involved in cell wall biosynthesis